MSAHNTTAHTTGIADRNEVEGVPVWEREQVMARFEHLAQYPGRVCVPISAAFSVSYPLGAPSEASGGEGPALAMPSVLVDSGWLALSQAGGYRQFVGVEYLAHEQGACENTDCATVWTERTGESADLGSDELMFARTEVITADDVEVSYLMHGSDLERFTADVGCPASELDLHCPGPDRTDAPDSDGEVAGVGERS